MREINSFFIALYRAGQFNRLDSGVGHFTITQDDRRNFDILRSFNHITVTPIGTGFAVELF